MLLFSILMIFTTVACSNTKDNSSGNNDQTSSNKPLKLSIFVASRVSDSLYSNETLVWKELGKRLNIQFDFITGDRKSMSDKFKLMIASGDYPDIVAGALGDFNKFGPQGAFIPLNDLIKKEAPNIQKYLMDDKQAKSQAIAGDGNMYSVPMLSAIRTSEGPLIRKDWLDRLGLQVPETIDDWYNVLKAFKEKDPTGNGTKGIVPFATTGSKDETYYLNFADAWGIDLNGDQRWMEDNGKLIYTPIDPRAKEFLATMNKWYSEGLLDKELLNRQEKDYQALVFGNKVGATNHWIGYVAGFNANPEAQKIKGFNFQVVPPPVLKKGDKPLTSRQQLKVVPLAWAISKSNKHVDATMKLFDYVYSDEGQLLFNFGVEGESYTKQSDGTLKYTDKIMNSPDGVGKAIQRLGLEALIGIRQDPRYERASCTSDDPVKNDACKQLFVYVDKNYFRDPAPALKYSDSDQEKYNEIMVPIDTYVNESISKFIIGEVPISKFDDFVAKVKSMRFDELQQIQNRAYEKYKSLK
jgi:putative aldouronate transport system substrate-binding protein